MNDQRKLEIINAALLKHADQLEESVSYWKQETDKAWETAKKWREDEIEKHLTMRANMDELCKLVEEVGSLLPVNTGGTLRRDPPDAILGAVIRMLSPKQFNTVT